MNYNCQPDPEQTCGELIPDSCIPISGIWPPCFPVSGPCYRQSDFNSAVSALLCNLAYITFGNPFTLPVELPAMVPSILASIDLSGLTSPCSQFSSSTNYITINTINTTVEAELQNIYDILCEYLPVSLNTPLNVGTPPGLNLKCLVSQCGTPISTLGNLLQALINEVCVTEGLIFEANLSQVGTGAPTQTILADSLDPTQNYLAWSYTGAGTYTLSANATYLPNAFPVNQTVIYIGSELAIGQQVVATRTSNTTIVLNSASGGTLADGILSSLSIRIKVYP